MPKVFVDNLLEITDSKKRYTTAMEVFRGARVEAGTEVETLLANQGRGALLRASQLAGCDEGGFGRRLRSGGFTVPPDGLVRLCYRMLYQSCHSIYFGEKGTTELPRLVTYFLNILIDMQESTREKFFGYTLELTEEDAREGKLLEQIPVADLMRMRISEAAADRFVMPENLFGDDAAPSLKTSVRKLMGAENPSTLRIQTLMFMAMELHTTLDYFIAPDYTAYTDMRPYGQTQGSLPHNRLIWQIIGKYLNLSPERKEVFGAHLLHYALSQNPTLPYADSYSRLVAQERRPKNDD